ncbi:expressed unknown protein [Seminavis robusta]|uniref:Uncharacterized protein n=1 Tax=Seminavis robusta TaxID=568900 RepID=A0A9N8DXB1_9STRA|nr:expressed unknown protein [Seminavis robusta]|eukprot:Sro439_g143210.1 n/a (191) ;mRNA; f:32798-33370
MRLYSKNRPEYLFQFSGTSWNLIGQCFPRLQDLQVVGDLPLEHSIQGLTQSVLILTDNRLCRLSVEGCTMDSHEAPAPTSESSEWYALVCALRSSRHLDQLTIRIRARLTDSILREAMIHRGKMHSKLDDKNPNQTTLEQFVKALIYVRSRADCLHYFLHPDEFGVSPDLYAKQEIGETSDTASVGFPSV